MSEYTGKIDGAQVLKEGTGKKGKWRLWKITTPGPDFVTFNKTHGETAHSNVGRTYRFEYHEEQKGDFTNNVLDELAGPLNDAPEQKQPTPGDGSYIKGQTAPADVRGISASVALENAVRTLGQPSGEGQIPQHAKRIEALANEYFRWLLEKRYDQQGQKSDEDIPFA